LDIPIKKTTYPAEQSRQSVQEKRKFFKETIKTIKVENFVSLDESSVNLAYTRHYGRAKTDERVSEGVFDARFERKSILSTVRTNGEMCPVIFDGTLNKELFAEYLKSQLKPTLKPDDILLLDNSSVHRSKLVLNTLENCGIKYLFLPPYSPDFNPIELLWAHMKSTLRKLKARTHDKLENAVKIALNSVENKFISNWFARCGYVVNT
jgi:transposase